jgi:putative ABC transport system permease protein
MEFSEIFSTAVEALMLNKVRTGLASLGIIIGIGAVIALVSLGQASQMSIQSQIQSLGSNMLTVRPGSQSSGGVQGAAGGGSTLTYDDAKAIASSAQVTTIAEVSPEFQQRSQVVAGRNNTNTQIIGATEAYESVHKLSISSGRFVSQQDVDGLGKVAILGPDVVETLFGTGADPIGQTVRINGIPFRVIGVTVSKGGTGFMNQDDIIYIPISTAQKQLYGVTYVSSISLSAMNEDAMNQARDEVGYFLLSRHKISDPTQADFSISSQEDIMSTMSSVTGTFTALLSGIAMISLLVGGIGIMNIMLVTVIERTREIGLRKSLGARRKDIVAQFLVEVLLLTIVGGVVGMIIGVLTSYIVTSLMSMPFTISWSAIALAIGVSGAIGIVFGLYPARKAASLSPIEALRFE